MPADTNRLHEKLHLVLVRDAKDYGPWGDVERWSDPDAAYPDCSADCKHAAWLEGAAGSDWCVCTNPKSHRAGLLTFEHQGCQMFDRARKGGAGE